MANASSTITAVGNENKLFTLPFSYISESHLKFYVNNVDTSSGSSLYTATVQTGGTQVEIKLTADNTTPVAGTVVKLERNTPITTPSVVFSNSSTLKASDLNTNTNQLLFAVQEAADDSANSIVVDGTSNWNALSKRIKNTADPVDAQDAATKAHVETVLASNAANVTAAQNAETAAVAAKDDAVVAKNDSVAAKNDAETAKNDSVTAKNDSVTAKNDAETAKNDSVTAKNASVAAKDLAVTAKNDAETAETAAELAETGAVTAKNDSVAAKNDAETAKNDSVAAKDLAVTAKNDAVTAKNDALTHAGTATTKAGEASTSAGTATTKAGEASTSAGTATTKASEASTSASTAVTKAGEASASASTAVTKASEASASASTATTKASEASTSAANAATSLSTFQGQYHGSASSDPTSGLDVGDLYFNSTANNLRVYNGSAWQVAAVSTTGTLVAANNLSDLGAAATARTNLGLANGATAQTSLGLGTAALSASTSFEAVDSDILRADTIDELAVGYSGATTDAGVKTGGTFTPSPDTSGGGMLHYVNGGAHVLGVPAKNCSLVILMKNNVSAGAVTTSGFTKVDGDSLTTTNSHEFFLYITRYSDGTTTYSSLTVKALQ